MKIPFQIFYVLLCLCLVGSCTYDNEENLACPTRDMSYSTDISPILEANGCIGCHNENFQSAGINLDGYNNVKPYVESGQLYGAINHEPGFKAMPQGGSKIDKCQINKIEAWIRQGAKDN